MVALTLTSGCPSEVDERQNTQKKKKKKVLAVVRGC